MVSTTAFTNSISVSDTNVDISGSASAAQNSQANGSTISADESATSDADLSLCPGQTPLCGAENQGDTKFKADFASRPDTTYFAERFVQASASEDLGNISANRSVTSKTC